MDIYCNSKGVLVVGFDGRGSDKKEQVGLGSTKTQNIE